MNGKFVTLEGCEGVGKSTQLKYLKEYLEREGVPAVFTREPGGTPLAERIRAVLLDDSLNISPEAEAELFATERRDHIDNFILPALNEGKLVVCDRYLDSSLAYQGFGRGLGLETVLRINAYAVGKCMPDLTVFIDMDPLKSFRKMSGKKIEHDRIETENAEFHAACYRGFKEIEKLYPERFRSVVPEQDKSSTHGKIIEALKKGGVL